MKRYTKEPIFRIILSIFLVLGYFFVGTCQLDTFPPVWWDEGWTLAVARNWVEFGHYGQMLDGEPRGPGLSAAFPVVAPVALSFKMFGVGIWQGRLPGLFFSLGAIALIVFLANSLYNRKVAFGTLFFLLLAQGDKETNLFLLGRQVLGEMPFIFYLLVGYLCFYFSLKRSPFFILLAAIFWGIAINTKAQVLPFWIVSMFLPLAVSIARRWWKEGLLIIIVMLSSWVLGGWVTRIQFMLTGGPIISEAPLEGLFSVTAIVLNATSRIFALNIFLIYGIISALGYMYAGLRLIKASKKTPADKPNYLMNLAFWCLGGSWLLWFVIFAAPWQRYIFPALFFSTIFVSALLFDLTAGFNFRKSLKAISQAIHHRKISKPAFHAIASLLIIQYSLFFMIFTLSLSLKDLGDQSLIQVSDYFSSNVSLQKTIETYDSELFFLLGQKYTYPPDQAHIVYNRRILLGEEISSPYDASSGKHDFLVVGPQSLRWQVYQDILTPDHYQLVLSTNRYQVYEKLQ
jgi:hypothetical protein